jgi:16S rRNA (adenine1518-N6/adenine1519-N6)-dimethyltransferase
MTKRLGQNFLINRGIRERILGELGAKPGERVWEIGPGIGSMTAGALAMGLSVTAFEIDHGFVRLLSRVFAGNQGFRLVEGDFLDTFRAEMAADGMPDLIFGNLPYNAASAIIATLIEARGLPRRLVFTVQREAAQRMTAKPGVKDYAAFTVLCASACRVRISFDLGAGVFWPPPRVTSSVVIFEPRPDPVEADNRLGFSRFVRLAFASRRKTLRNNLRAGGYAEGVIDRALAGASLEAAIRAEALSPELLATLYSALRLLAQDAGLSVS